MKYFEKICMKNKLLNIFSIYIPYKYKNYLKMNLSILKSFFIIYTWYERTKKYFTICHSSQNEHFKTLEPNIEHLKKHTNRFFHILTSEKKNRYITNPTTGAREKRDPEQNLLSSRRRITPTSFGSPPHYSYDIYIYTYTFIYLFYWENSKRKPTGTRWHTRLG